MNNDVTMHEHLSALADGELRGDDFARVMDFAGTPQGQAAWHAYHLVGDVLRGVHQPQTHVAHDVLLQRLRSQLAQEQRPMAVAAAAQTRVQIHRSAANAAEFRWKLVAGVASLAAVVAVGWNTLATQEAVAPQGAQLALVQPVALPQAGAQPGLALVSSIGLGSSVAPGADALALSQPVMIRDPRLDELLAAHRRFGHTAALQAPAGFLRNASFAQPAKQNAN